MESSSTILQPAGWSDFIPLASVFPDITKPLEVDVGCGKGRFLIARARTNPGVNFIGIDRLVSRLRKIDARVQRQAISNVRLLHLDAAYAVEYLLPPASVSTFYIFFPDPWPKRKHHRRRLFSPDFLNAVHRSLKPGGKINAATDHPDYFVHIRKVFAGDQRFKEVPAFVPTAEEQTDFEITFLGKGMTIGRCAFTRS